MSFFEQHGIDNIQKDRNKGINKVLAEQKML